MATGSSDAMGWIEFGVRAALALGQGVQQLVAAMQGGDVRATEALAAQLDPADQILARATAVKARQAARAVAALEEAGDDAAGDGDDHE